MLGHARLIFLLCWIPYASRHPLLCLYHLVYSMSLGKKIHCLPTYVQNDASLSSLSISIHVHPVFLCTFCKDDGCQCQCSTTSIDSRLSSASPQDRIHRSRFRSSEISLFRSYDSSTTFFFFFAPLHQDQDQDRRRGETSRERDKIGCRATSKQ